MQRLHNKAAPNPNTIGILQLHPKMAAPRLLSVKENLQERQTMEYHPLEALIVYYGQHGGGKEAFELFVCMTRYDCCPDELTLCITEVKKSDGARGLELRAHIQKELEEGFWSFLDQFGSCTRGASHHCALLPSEVQNMIKKIPQELRTRLAIKGYNPQDGFAMSYLCVPPICLQSINVLDGNAFRCSSGTSTNLLQKGLRKVAVANSITYSLNVRQDNPNKNHTILKVGEIIGRRVLDGDVVFLNRPPSTDKHSVEAFYVQVHK
ncbi:hypothetical protein ABZP36_004987 [Zizania latifolia]